MSPDGEQENGGTNMDSIMSSCRFPIALQFVDISYSVKRAASPGGGGIRRLICGGTDPPADERSILNGVTGMVSPGEMLAVLGPSGSGKSTLLNVLAGRLAGKHSGSVLANGNRFTRPVLRRTGFVTQDDVLYPHLTVRETLVFCAMLRLPAAMSRAEKVAAADAVAAELGLGKCAHTRVGGTFVRGVSGGERKRVSIGHEMLLNPSLLVLDEPTSGLDSTAAGRMVALLGRVAGRGRTVVAAVHQPSSRVFQMFDSVLLLSEGSCLYFGPGRDAMDYFGSAGFAPRFQVNPADFMLDLANGVALQIEDQGDADRLNVKRSLVSSYNKSLASKVKACVHAAAIASQSTTKFGIRGSNEKNEKDFARISWFTQFGILLLRGLKERRHESFQFLRVSQVIAAAILAGTMWWRSHISNIPDRLGLLFFISIFWGVLPSFSSVYTFPQDRNIFIKERASRMYTLSSYFMARTAGDLPMELILPFIFATIVYWMAGLQPSSVQFLLTLIILLSYVLTAQGLGLALGAMIGDAKKASTVVTVTMLAFLLTGGFYVHHVPEWMDWMKYTSVTFYCYRLLIVVQYGRSKERESLIVERELTGPATTSVCVAALILMLVGYRIIAYAALRRMKA